MAVYNALNGNITYNLNGVPVFDEKRKITDTSKMFILLSTQQESDDDTSDAFITDSSIDIEVQHRSGFEVSKDAIDDISDQILQIIMPTPQTNGLTAPSGFQITLVRRISTVTRQFQITDANTIIAKIIRITCKIVQQFD